jgi:hypothetical protein
MFAVLPINRVFASSFGVTGLIESPGVRGTDFGA